MLKSIQDRFRNLDPPILIGAYNDRAVIRAAQLGDGWIVPPELSSTILDRKICLFRNETKLGRKRGFLTMMRAFHITTTESEEHKIRDLISSHFRNKK